jgi:hypothetical protein
MLCSAFLLLCCTPAYKSFSGPKQNYEIKLQRTACYGNCPIYQVTVRGDGQIDYEGFANVRSMGKQNANIPADSAALLLSELQKMNFYELKHTYTQQNITDLSTVLLTLSYTVNGETFSKQIVDYQGDTSTPAELRAFYTHLEQICGTSRWIR